MSILTPLVGQLTIGLIFALMGFGILLTYRYFNFVDMTTDASFTSGAVISLVLISHNTDPLLSTMIGCIAGMLVGVVTGVLYTKLGIEKMLSGIIVMIMMYPVHLEIMGQPWVQTSPDQATLVSYAREAGVRLFGGETIAMPGGSTIPASDVILLLCCLAVVVFVATLLYFFFQTHVGLALRSVGENPGMARAVGIHVDRYTILAVALANGLTALSGSLFAQSESAFDISGGIGMVIVGLSGVIVGGSILGLASLRRVLLSAVAGVVLIRLLMLVVILLYLPEGFFKLFTALFLVAALILPDIVKRRRQRALVSASSKPQAP